MRGGLLRILTQDTDAPPAPRSVRAVASRSLFLCDGMRPATLLGVLPGLSPAAAHAVSPTELACGVRFILRSYEVDAVASSPAEANAWVLGVNSLPFGSKQLALADAARKHAAASAAADARRRSEARQLQAEADQQQEALAQRRRSSFVRPPNNQRGRGSVST